jgi:hypothetical protein
MIEDLTLSTKVVHPRTLNFSMRSISASAF